jgi:hypothetical protein
MQQLGCMELMGVTSMRLNAKTSNLIDLEQQRESLFMSVIREFNNGGFLSIKWAAVDVVVIVFCLIKLV